MRERRLISEEEFHAWKSDPVTKEIIARMNETVEFIKQQWYSGSYRETDGGQDGTTKNENDFWLGFANGVHEFLRIELRSEVESPKTLKGLKE